MLWIGEGFVVLFVIIGEVVFVICDIEWLWFCYIDGVGCESVCCVELYVLVLVGCKWFLLCWDFDWEDWCMFWVDCVVVVEYMCVLFL